MMEGTEQILNFISAGFTIFALAAVVAVLVTILTYRYRKYKDKLNRIKKNVQSELDDTIRHSESQRIIIKKQLDTLAEFSEAAYRIKNTARDIVNSLESGEINSKLKTQIDDLKNRFEAFVELMYESRLYLDSDIFSELHNFKNLVSVLYNQLSHIELDSTGTNDIDMILNTYKNVENAFKESIQHLHTTYRHIA